ncbi:MAG: ATP-binding domain-containing protein [Rhizobiales bacterium]|nr:ATP-binding domain-containing protein [Hyphomicrobiales bacterium]
MRRYRAGLHHAAHEKTCHPPIPWSHNLGTTGSSRRRAFPHNATHSHEEDGAFTAIKIDHSRENNDAIQLGRFDSSDEGLAEIARRRAHARAAVPPEAVSTIHKAKSLEFPHVVLATCDRRHFNDTQAARVRLYVALSRATESLALLVSHTHPTPLLRI